MRSIANLVAIALRLHNEHYDRTHDKFEDLAVRKRITNDEALVVRGPLMDLIELSVADGDSRFKGVRGADTRLEDIYRADAKFSDGPPYYWKLGPIKVFPEQDIASLFRRR